MSRFSVLQDRRARLLGVFLAPTLCIFTVTRGVLFFKYLRETPFTPVQAVSCFIIGLRFDLAVLACLLVPLWLWLMFIPDRWLAGRTHRYVLYAKALAWNYLFLFLGVIEYVYFQEFDTRLDFVAVNYLIYPREVFVNIWESFPIVKISGLTAAAALAVFGIVRPFISKSLETGAGVFRRSRMLFLGTVFVLASTLTVSWETSEFSPNRVLNQVSMNGLYSLIYAAWTKDLDYHHYYPAVPEQESFARLKKYFARPGESFVANSGNPIEREISAKGPLRRMNVVIIVEESLGLDLLGPRPGDTVSLTPEIDRLAGQSLFFTNFYATGNRTDRGLEAILTSFPPMPGKSILRRKYSDNIASIARVLRDAGYRTEFIYGGRGMFDGMRPFMTANGFDQFIEQKDYEHPTHVTSWGVCDEDIFHKALSEFDRFHTEGKPFLGVIMTVSNHRPFTFPRGRVPYDPDKKARHHAVAYADWAVGDFFRQVRRRDYASNTIFVLLGDHGERVTGAQNVPIRSYEIPLIIHAPALFPEARRVTALGSSIDVTPTILGLLGLPYRSVFYGRDMLHDTSAANFALMSHNLDAAWFDGRRMIMIGIPKKIQMFQYDPHSRALTPDPEPIGNHQEEINDAISFFQSGFDLYYYKLYHTGPPG